MDALRVVEPDVNLATYIRTISDYPKPGIQFRDITTLLAHPFAFRTAVDDMVWPFLALDVDVVVGIEARGFILGGAIAHELGVGFVPIRKKGKLPSKTRSKDYQLEYGVDTIEIHEDAISSGAKVLLVDDLIATGGTANAALDLIVSTGGVPVGTTFVIDLPDLGGSDLIKARDIPVHSLLSYDGH